MSNCSYLASIFSQLRSCLANLGQMIVVLLLTEHVNYCYVDAFGCIWMHEGRMRMYMQADGYIRVRFPAEIRIAKSNECHSDHSLAMA